MKYETASIRIRLAADESLAISDGAGCTVRLVKGLLWITRHNDSADIFLRAPKTLELDRPGLAIVTAGADSELEVICADEHVEVRPLRARRHAVPAAA